MTIRRRDILKFATAAAVTGALPRRSRAASEPGVYDLEPFGNARILHMTDTHAQLLPVFFREPSVNIGVGAMAGQPPHLVGRNFLEHFQIRPDSADAYAFTYLDFEKSAARFGRLGGFAHLKTLIDRLRDEAGPGKSMLLDGGDLWQGSGLANAMQGADMVEAANLLGIEAMTGHWEFTYGEKVLRDNLAKFKGEFIAQNVFLTEEAAFNDAPAFDSASGRVFKPYVIKEIGGHRVAVIGQAFPYVPIAHPKRFTPDWTFGIRDDELQKLVYALRSNEKIDAVVLLSHNGMDVDLKLASRVSGIDVILGGHTHDAVPQPIRVNNSGGVTLVTNAGSNGKFLGVLDLDLAKGKLRDVVVRIKNGTTGAHEAPKDPVVIDQRECSYTPRVTGIVAGQKLLVKNSDQKVEEYVAEVAKQAGGPAKVEAFVRLALGEGVEKQTSDFAAEVASMTGGA